MAAHPLRLYAHRGASALAPENTLPAFQLALDAGADALELDVHLTRDGHVVVSHDADAARMAGIAAPWGAMDLAQVRRLDAGHGFVAPDGRRPFAGRGLTIPTLDEVLGTLPPVVVNVDIKQVRPSMVGAVLDVVRRHGAHDRVVLTSFHLPTLLALRRQFGGATGLCKVEVAALAWLPRRLLAALLPQLGRCVQVPVRSGAVVLGRPPFIDKCHALGMRVDFWTVNDPAQARELLRMGADGIMTDDPAALAPVFRAPPSR